MGRRTCRAVQRTASHPSGAEILTRGFPRIHHCITAVFFFYPWIWCNNNSIWIYIER
jgi:hypothetical protein